MPFRMADFFVWKVGRGYGKYRTFALPFENQTYTDGLEEQHIGKHNKNRKCFVDEIIGAETGHKVEHTTQEKFRTSPKE